MNELLTLSRLRLERDLTYQQLADEVGMPFQTLYRLLTVPNARVHDRSLFKIQRYLSAQAENVGVGISTARKA